MLFHPLSAVPAHFWSLIVLSMIVCTLSQNDADYILVPADKYKKTAFSEKKKLGIYCWKSYNYCLACATLSAPQYLLETPAWPGSCRSRGSTWRMESLVLPLLKRMDMLSRRILQATMRGSGSTATLIDDWWPSLPSTPRDSMDSYIAFICSCEGTFIHDLFVDSCRESICCCFFLLVIPWLNPSACQSRIIFSNRWPKFIE